MPSAYRMVSIAAAALAFSAGAASAADPPPPSQAAAAVAEYVETLPSAGGPTTGDSTPNGTNASTRNTIPPPVAKKIAATGATDASRLTNLLESNVYGGPAEYATGRSKPTTSPAAKVLAHPLIRRGSLASVVTSDPGGTLAFWLLIVAASAVPLVLRRASRPRQPGPHGAGAR